MPDDISALYPHPPQPQGGGILSRDPLSILSPLMELQKFQAQKAVGEAAQDAIGLDGNIDPNAWMAGIKSRGPAAALAAPQAAHSALDAWQKNVNIGTTTFAQKVAMSDRAADVLVPYSFKDKMSDEDVYNATTQLAAVGVTPDVLSGMMSGLRGMSPAQRSQQLKTWLAQRAGAPAMAAPTEGGVVQQGPNVGARPIVRTGDIVAGGGGAGGGQGGGPPMSGLGARGQDILADQQEFREDQTKSANTIAALRPLQQALPLIQQMSNFDFGVGSKDISKIRSLATMLGVAPDKMKSAQAMREEVNKYLVQYVNGPHQRSDMELSSRVAGTPNIDLTQPALLGLVRSQFALDRQDAALATAGAAARAGNNYKGFKTGYYPSTDPKGFMVDQMSPEEIRAYVKGLSPADRAKFNRAVHYGSQAGYFSAPSVQGQGQ